jgi:hypothetical protein
MIWTLQAVRDHAEMVAGLWNGDNAGKLEEAASAAKELLEHLNKVEACLKEIEHLDESDVMYN